jgi:hypothetical protein
MSAHREGIPWEGIPSELALFCLLAIYISHTLACEQLLHTHRVGQDRIYIPYTNVHLVIPSQKYRIYTVYIWFCPTLCIHTLLANSSDTLT